MTIAIRKGIIYFLLGIGFGSLSFIATLWLNGAEDQTVLQITNVVWISGLIGLFSMIFELERPSFVFRLLLHFCLVYSSVVLMNGLNHYGWHLLSLTLLANVILTYLLIWGVVYFILTRRLEKINRKLAEKRREQS
ncbi:DUF3021 domain-containing protein [Streptococcus tangpeifui]|uniref:DUF3021 domain-containing protein n=1 Tax=Streptococcus tangpeifui TaxID=2709400 RepID=UPI0013EC3994|nr:MULTISPECIES: DUF3021 domain-containing protein [unclassified Streptococcus]